MSGQELEMRKSSEVTPRLRPVAIPTAAANINRTTLLATCWPLGFTTFILYWSLQETDGGMDRNIN